MDSRKVAFLLTMLFSAFGVGADTCLKLASRAARPYTSKWFFLGLTAYALTAFCWTHVMRTLKLGTIAVIYSVTIVILLTTVGIVGFDEKLSRTEILGMLMGIASLVMLARFAE
jgi:multidrug transporter EmrE-like cation transporter